MNKKSFILILVIVALSLFGYIKYILANLPLNQSFLENFRVVRFATAYDLFYLDDINNFEYAKLAKQYREDLKNYYKPLSSDEQKFIWQNYIKIYKFQKEIKFKILPHTKQPIIYKFDTKSYDVKAKLTVSIVPQICDSIDIDFTKPPKIDINIKDKKLYDFIKTNTKKTYEVLKQNRKFKK